MGASLRGANVGMRTVLRKGLAGEAGPGFAPGASGCEVKAGARVVGSGRATVRADGTARARVPFTRSARRSLARRRSVRLVVIAGSVTTTITVKR